MAKAIEIPSTKFIVEYFNDQKQVQSRWHYDYEKTKNGPVLVEEFNLPQKERKSIKSKK
jgi:hypothetical protein